MTELIQSYIYMMGKLVELKKVGKEGYPFWNIKDTETLEVLLEYIGKEKGWVND